MARDSDTPESGSHSGSSTSSPSTYSTSSPSSPAAHGTLGANGLTSADMGLSGMGESLITETGQAERPSSSTPSPAQEAARAATKTSLRKSSSDAPSPTSMAKKRGNQPH